MNLLSALNRANCIEELSNSSFDLLIIGGGITGAGIALDAASRGLKVALVEKNDFASGTSSKSTKLIHGGLRYLKQLEIALVREVGKERATVHQLAPHLVTAEKMLLPLVKGGTYGEWATSLGLWVYDILAGVGGEDKRKMLNKSETIEKEPLIRKDILQGGGFYAEYRTDDARLTIENIKTAARFNAVSLNYVQADSFHYDNGKVKGAHCTDLQTGNTFQIKADYVISAAGPWVDQLRKKDESLSGKHLFLSKGVHIVVPHEKLPINNAVYFDVPDGRMIFAIPRNRITYIGTTDTHYTGDKNDIPINLEDVNYLLEATNAMFPENQLRVEDVESSWAGLRALIYEEGKSASEMSRKDEIFESETGLLSIAGGKLTGYRKMSERIVDLVANKIKKASARDLKKNHTDTINLTGGPFKNAAEVLNYKNGVAQQLQLHGLSDAYFAKYLVANYGKQSDEILVKMKEFEDEAEIALARAEVWYCIHSELSATPLDFLNRRSGRLYFDLPSIARIREVVFEDFARYFNWSAETLEKHQADLDHAIKRVTVFESADEQVA